MSYRPTDHLSHRSSWAKPEQGIVNNMYTIIFKQSKTRMGTMGPLVWLLLSAFGNKRAKFRLVLHRDRKTDDPPFTQTRPHKFFPVQRTFKEKNSDTN